MIFNSQVSMIEYIAALLVAFVACVAVLGALSYIDTDRGLLQTWGRLLRRIAPSRMQRMLKHRNVDLVAYLRATPVVDMKAQARNCDCCTRTTLCDEVLSHEGAAATDTDFSFCPNSHAMGAVAHYRTDKRPAS